MSVNSLELTARTMLFTRPIAGLDDFVEHPDDALVDVVEQPERAAAVWRERRAALPGWSDGALLLGYNARPLIDLTMWDAVWPLWSYLITVVEEYLDNGRGECSFPHQAVDVALFDRGGETFILIGDRQLDVHRDSFIDQLLAAAHDFFEWVAECTDDDPSEELTQIADLQQRRSAE
ncbi:hypothetical protein GCM10022198_23130 [Klugiella xanthotipulae]|uniref:Uncharacterized protein n=1 Tax=Klugiella xanthotipulae TaxID=244735 RepID=A0A543I5V7_9MICO|nr:hypothetical protein [Klugiella xanthotipulae]TQM65959.1 hypothetical protein FB466_0779 [Klugiella xanthotipulae]